MYTLSTRRQTTLRHKRSTLLVTSLESALRPTAKACTLASHQSTSREYLESPLRALVHVPSHIKESQLTCISSFLLGHSWSLRNPAQHGEGTRTTISIHSTSKWDVAKSCSEVVHILLQ